MKKETIIAIGLGVLLGVFTSFFFLSSERKQKPPTKIIPFYSPVPSKKTTTPIVIQNLEIDSPQNNALFEEDKIIIKGHAPKKSLIIIQSPIKELVFENKEEKFEKEFPLAYGANQINIYAYPKNIKTPLFKSLTVYYLKNKL